MQKLQISYLLTKYYFHKQLNIQPDEYIIQSAGSKYKWETLVHNGVMFPPEYVPHNIPVIYENEEIYLSPPAEEAITLYAKFKDTEYIKLPKFNKNFWNDFKKILGPNHKIKSLENLDFTRIYNHLLSIKDQKNKKSKEEKEQDKQKLLNIEEKYKTALVNGKPQPVGNYKVEPPGIFLGRGNHPKLGKIKRRIYPEDIVINISKDAPIPPSLPNHHWKQIIHDRTVEWLASWKDDITNKIKYVWLGATSEIRTQEDKNKFDLARKLKKKIKKIRKINEENLINPDIKIKQIATALYFIDKLALRVGNEKNDDQADTVGVTSLRVEHLTLLEGNKIKLDFLSKDSVRYNRIIQIDEQVYKNLNEFIQHKNKSDNLFDKINSNDMNKYLQNFMKDLTAKVFRTYNSSDLFQKELKKK